MDNSPDAITHLLDQLRDSDSLIRENSAYMLGEIALEAQNISKNSLRSPEQLRKINALTDEMLRERVSEALIGVLDDKDSWVRGNAADALGKVRSRAALGPLSKLLDDDSGVVRYSAVLALSEIDSQGNVESLISALSDSEWSVRLAAVKALASVTDVRAEEALQRTTKDKNPDVRDVSISAIAEMNP